MERILQAMHPDITLHDLRNNIDKIEKKLETKVSTKDDNFQVESTIKTPFQNIVGKNTGLVPVLNNVTSKMASTADESFISFIDNYKDKDPEQNGHSNESQEGQNYGSGQFKSIGIVNSRQKQEIKSVLQWMLQEPLAIIPSEEIVLRLVDVFINICETNFFYIHPRRSHEQIKILLMKKRDGDMEYLQRNWDTVVILLGILSISTCYEYIQNEDGIPINEPQNSWEDPGHIYYLKMLPFIGIVLNNNNVTSIQVLQLIGVYMTTKKADIVSVSIDLGYKYMYLALEIAISNNLHLCNESKEKGEEGKEFLKRIWWSCYTLERRLGVNFGKPSPIKFEDITVSLPSDVLNLRHYDNTSNYLNQCAMIRIIYIFGKISALVYNQGNRPEADGLLSIESKTIRDISNELDLWKAGLPKDCLMETLDPHKNLYRGNCHLTMFYYLGKIYLGKPFLLFQVENYKKSVQNFDQDVSIFINYLTSVCIDSAFNIFKILSTMKDNGKLGIYSSTDLNFCNISLFVVIAFLKIDQSQSTKLFLKMGLEILESLSKGCSSAKVNLSRFKKIESKLSEELEDQSSGNYTLIDNSSVFPEMNINLYANDFQLYSMNSMVLPDAISSTNLNNKGGNSHISTGDDFSLNEDFFVNYPSHDLDWIQEIDVESYI